MSVPERPTSVRWPLSTVLKVQREKSDGKKQERDGEYVWTN